MSSKDVKISFDSDWITTAELNDELKATKNIKDFLKRNERNLITCGLSEYLNFLLSQKGLSRAEVVRGSMLTRGYVYQIFSGEKTPSRDKLIAIAFGLGLTDDETQQMLKISGNRELYVRDERDVLILFALQRNQTIFEANNLLFEHGFGILGNF